jgi:hypothetical protein
MQEVDLKDVDQMVQPEYTPWITNMEFNIDTTMIALPKGSSTLRIRAELEETLNAKYPDYTQIYTDGSKPQVKTKRFDCQYLFQSLMQKQLTQLSR